MKFLTINGPTTRHKRIAADLDASTWTKWLSSAKMALVISSYNTGKVGDVLLEMTREEAIDLAVDILKQANKLKDAS